MLHEDTYWDYGYAQVFMDGGSVAFGFMNREGLPLYVWAQAPESRADSRQFFLKQSFNDPHAVEILPGSDLEMRVLDLLDKARQHSGTKLHLPRIDLLKESILNRSMPYPFQVGE